MNSEYGVQLKSFADDIIDFITRKGNNKKYF